MQRMGLLKVCCLLSTLMATGLFGQIYKTQDAAIKETFADADTVIRQTLFLDKDELKTLQKKSKCKFNSQIISYYVGKKEGQLLGYAFFEDEVVRTKKAITMVVVTPEGEIENVEVLAFFEPEDYLPITKWFGAFLKKKLTAALWPGREVHAITGATLSVRAFTFSTRRALVVYDYLRENNT